MTEEELEKEAEEWLCNNLHSASEEDFIKAMVDIAEPREKQIAELSKHIVELQNDKGELIDRCKDLEAQIEKMKCGQNCKHSYLYQEDRKCKFTYCDCINCKDKWELRR